MREFSFSEGGHYKRTTWNEEVLFLPIFIPPMEASDRIRQQIIKRLLAKHCDEVVDAAITVWQQITNQIILIVGETGFNSLFARSVFVTQSTYPWLAASSLSPQTDSRFEELERAFKGQTVAQASEANILLLTTFTDILASLIGEHLTANILRSAWGDVASGPFDKEFKKNE